MVVRKQPSVGAGLAGRCCYPNTALLSAERFQYCGLRPELFHKEVVAFRIT
jgi:hypothetical protein